MDWQVTELQIGAKIATHCMISKCDILIYWQQMCQLNCFNVVAYLLWWL